MLLPGNNGSDDAKIVIDTSTSLTETILGPMSTMRLQVYGEFTSGVVTVYGKLADDAPYVGIFAINLAEAAVKKNGQLDAASIYEVDTGSMISIKISLSSTYTGNIKVCVR